MTQPKNYSGLTIGSVFTVLSLLSTLTFIVPIISVLSGVMFETISKALINNDPYSNVGKLTILLLTLTLILTIIISLISIKSIVAKTGQFSRGGIIVIMIITYLIVHPLGFYIYWGLGLDFRSDGQLIFGAKTSFPVSSFTFLFIGLLIDIVKNTTANKRFDASMAGHCYTD